MSRPACLIVLLASCGSSTPIPVEEPRSVSDPVPVGEPAGRVPETPRPELRLPAEFAPTAYTARLALDPAQPTFRGEIDIDATLAQPASILWLHGDGLTIDAAEARVGGERIALAPTVDDSLVALRAARDLPAGALTVHLEYGGTLYPFGQRAVVATVATWVRDHVAELFERMPEAWRRSLIWPVVAPCDGSQRDTIASWANQHITAARGGERAVAQALERLDQCVAQRAALGPQVDAWTAAQSKRRKR